MNFFKNNKSINSKLFAQKTRISLLCVLFFMCVLNSMADNSYSQTVQLNMNINKPSLKEAIVEIKNQTEFDFLYSKDIEPLYKANEKVIVEDGTIEEVLDKLFSNSLIDYKIVDKTIVLTPRKIAPEKANDVRQVMQQGITVSGTVTDDTRDPLPGVNVFVRGTTTGTITDVNGKYSIQVTGTQSVIVFSYIGFVSQEITVGNQTSINVIMREDAQKLGEVVVIGYGVKTKESLTGAIAAVSGEDIITTKNNNVQNMLTGKLPGVRVYEKSSEPGAFAGNFDIRGFGEPMIVIDGVIRDRTAFQRLDPNDIENLSVLKDASAAIYGVRAANGVLLVTTIKGNDTGGKVTVNYSGRMGWQFPSGSPRSTTATEWMVLRNEKVMRAIDTNNTPPYSEEYIQNYLANGGTSTDWWNEVMQTAAPERQHNINISGGNNRVTYFMSGGYSYNESFLRSNDYNYNRYNIRSNITANITDRLKVSLNMYGMMDKRNRGFDDTDRVIYTMQRCPAIMPIYVNNNPKYLYYGMIEGEQPYANSNSNISGYRKNEVKEFNGSASISYQMPYITGLTASAMFSYNERYNINKQYVSAYEMFKYNEATDEYISTGFRNSPSYVRQEFYIMPQMLYNIALDYKHKFNDHKVDALVVWEGQRRQGDNFYARRDLSVYIDYLFAGNTANQLGSMSADERYLYNKTNQALAGRFGYDYKSKYLLEFAFRYDGSSVFDTKGRWGFFPSVSGGWRVAEENFWKNSVLGVVNNFKLRASWGKMGDDSPASGYNWLQGWNYPATGGSATQLPSGYYFDGVFIASANSRGIINPNLSWVIAETINLGVDADAWNGLLGVSFDYFIRNRTGKLATRDVSISSTLGASMPQENLNSDRNFGYELELRHKNQIADFKYNVSAMVAYTRTMTLHREIARAGNSWLNYTRYDNENRYQGINAGRGADGRFQSYAEIANSPVYYDRSALPGDYKYLDWNGDGRIDGLDEHPIAYEQNATPPLYYSLSLNGEWKGFDLSMLWQGTAMSYVRYSSQLYEPMWGSDYSNALVFFLDRWHPTKIGVNPYEHTTEWIPGYFSATGSGTALPNSSSEHNLYNTSYLRLKTIELGYTVSAPLLQKVKIQGVRVYVNGYNLFTIKHKDLISDPEHTSDSSGNVYPIAKSFSVGLNLKF